ncbi:MAG: restriction endonuclease, partial [Planctomycetes bacterium]|nr:restriction endonuclease [Planctomycetota bacterium]
RDFGTQLLCEQVIGRVLRRQSYETNEEGQLNVEYADVLGIPFDFTAKPVVAPVKPPKESVVVRAISPDRDACLIRFPRVEGYRVRLPGERLDATFTTESDLRITPETVGPTQTRNEGIIGEGVDLRVDPAANVRKTTLVYHLTKEILQRAYRDADGAPELHLFGQLRSIVETWLTRHVKFVGGTGPRHLLLPALLDEAANRIKAAILRSPAGERAVEVLLSPYEPVGSTASVHFSTSREDRWKTRDDRCHVNWVVCDSTWEAEFCRVVEEHPRVHSYVKNHGLGFAVPYHMDGQVREYRPDFIARIEDGHGGDDLLNLVVEVKGYRREDAKRKKETMETHWIPGVNRWGGLGRWAFAEFSEPFAMEQDLDEAIAASVASLIEDAVGRAGAGSASMTGRA